MTEKFLIQDSTGYRLEIERRENKPGHFRAVAFNADKVVEPIQVNVAPIDMLRLLDWLRISAKDSAHVVHQTGVLFELADAEIDSREVDTMEMFFKKGCEEQARMFYRRAFVAGYLFRNNKG